MESLERQKLLAGFSLTEILIVLAMFALIGTLVLPLSLNAYQSYNFKNEQELLISLLRKTRSQSMSNINQSPHGLRIDPIQHKYILFQGADYSHRDIAFDVVFEGSNNYSFSGLSEVVFEQLSGDLNIAGNVIIDDHQHPSAKIILNHAGQINW